MRYIYLHGFASSPASKKAQFFQERFAGLGIRLEIPDLAGGDFPGLTISGQLRVIQREAGSEPVSLVGSSLGGYLAALYASRHPEVDRIVLLAPAFGFTQRWRERLGSAGLEEWRSRGYLEVPHYGSGTNERIGFGLIEDAQRYPDYPAVTQPALVFHGLKDDVVPPEAARNFVRMHPQAQLHLLDSGHELIDCLDTLWDYTRLFFSL